MSKSNPAVKEGATEPGAESPEKLPVSPLTRFGQVPSENSMLYDPVKENQERRQAIIDKRDEEIKGVQQGKSENGEAITNVEAHERFNDDKSDSVQKVDPDKKLEDTPGDQVPDEKSPESAETPEEGSPEHQSLPYYLKDGVPMLQLKVRGEVIEMPLERVKGIAQKNILAENRLRQVSTAERKLQNREKLVSQREQQLKSQSQSHPPPAGVEPKIDLSAIVKDTATVLFDGNKEEAEVTLRKFADALINPGSNLDQEELRSSIVQSAKDAAASVYQVNRQAEDAEKQRIAVKLGLEKVAEQFPEVMQDDVLFSMVDRRCEDLVGLHPDWSPDQVMVTAAREIQERVQGKKVVSTPASSPERKARKEGLQIVPAQSATATKPATPSKDEVDTSPGAVIARMREQRSAIAGQN